jgi:hypothetical protein
LNSPFKTLLRSKKDMKVVWHQDKTVDQHALGPIPV